MYQLQPRFQQQEGFIGDQIPTTGILQHEDERLRKVMLTNVKKEVNLQDIKTYLVEKTGISFGNILNVQIKEPFDKTRPTVMAEILFDTTKSTDLCILNLYKHADEDRELKG